MSFSGFSLSDSSITLPAKITAGSIEDGADIVGHLLFQFLGDLSQDITRDVDLPPLNLSLGEFLPEDFLQPW